MTSYNDYGLDQYYATQSRQPDRPSSELNMPATTGLSLALAGFCAIVILGIPLAVAGIVFSHVGLAHSRRTGSGRGQALAGLWFGYITIVAQIIFAVIITANLGYGLVQAANQFASNPYLQP